MIHARIRRPAAAFALAAPLTAVVPAPAFLGCPWDCAEPRDGIVNVTDFLALLGQWGEVGSSCDFDGGGVGVPDFLAMLAEWGCADRHEVHLDLELAGVFTPCDRCIAVEDFCVTTDVVLSFTDHDGNPATPVRCQETLVFEGVKCDVLTYPCIKDEQHTLSAGGDAVPGQVLVLRGGDLNNDDAVDTFDLDVLLALLGQGAQPGGCPWDGTPDADLNGDGIVDEADEAVLLTYFGEAGACPDGPSPAGFAYALR